MLFWLKKAIGYSLMPLPFCLGLMALGLLLVVLKRKPRVGRVLVAIGFVLLLLFSNKRVGVLLLRPLESRFAPVAEVGSGQSIPASLASCHVIVVLGSGHTDNPAWPAIDRLSTAGLARITEAVRIARMLPGSRLIVSGPSDGRGPTHASVLKAAAVSLGIAADRISEIDTARDTDDEAQEVRRRLGAGAHFAVVSSASHLPRAVGLMRRTGLDPVPCPTGFLARTTASAYSNEWLFSNQGLEMSTWALYEYLGTAWAKLQGKI